MIFKTVIKQNKSLIILCGYHLVYFSIDFHWCLVRWHCQAWCVSLLARAGKMCVALSFLNEGSSTVFGTALWDWLDAILHTEKKQAKFSTAVKKFCLNLLQKSVQKRGRAQTALGKAGKQQVNNDFEHFI